MTIATQLLMKLSSIASLVVITATAAFAGGQLRLGSTE